MGSADPPWRQFIDRSPPPLNEYFRDFSIIFPGIKGLGLPVRFSGNGLNPKESERCTHQFVSVWRSGAECGNKGDGQAVREALLAFGSLSIRYSSLMYIEVQHGERACQGLFSALRPPGRFFDSLVEAAFRRARLVVEFKMLLPPDTRAGRQINSMETFGPGRGTVRRPCHNEVDQADLVVGGLESSLVNGTVDAEVDRFGLVV